MDSFAAILYTRRGECYDLCLSNQVLPLSVLRQSRKPPALTAGKKQIRPATRGERTEFFPSPHRVSSCRQTLRIAAQKRPSVNHAEGLLPAVFPFHFQAPRQSRCHFSLRLLGSAARLTGSRLHPVGIQFHRADCYQIVKKAFHPADHSSPVNIGGPLPASAIIIQGVATKNKRQFL